jgi:TolB-like protein
VATAPAGPAAYPLGFGAVLEPAGRAARAARARAARGRGLRAAGGRIGPPAPPPAHAVRSRAGGGRAARRLVGAGLVAAGLALALTWGALRRDGEVTPAIAAETVGALSVVVLPFVDLSGGAPQAYFADGLTDELTATLSRLDGVRVLARTSAFSLRNHDVDVRQIGRTFAVSHVVEGTVRRTGARLRVTARLVDARTGYQLWAETYERAEGDVFRIEDDLAASIVRALSEHLGPGAPAALPAPPARTPVALPAVRGLPARSLRAAPAHRTGDRGGAPPLHRGDPA